MTRRTNKNDHSAKQKRDLLRLLKQEHVRGKNKHDFKQMDIIFETKRLQQGLGMLKLEYYENSTLSTTASLMIPITSPNPNQPSTWDDISVGESRFYGITLDMREATFREQISGFIKRTLEDSRLQDLLPWAHSNSKS